MLKKVDFGPPAQGIVAQKASALVAQELIQQVPQIQVAPQVDMSVLDDDEPETEPQLKAKKPEEKPKVVERTADGPQHLKDASGWLLSCMTSHEDDSGYDGRTRRLQPFRADLCLAGGDFGHAVSP